MRTSRVDRRLLCPTVALLSIVLSPLPALAIDCEINVFNAYQVARKNGRDFDCYTGKVWYPTLRGDVSETPVKPVLFSTQFVTYPPPVNTIGCVIKTGPLLSPYVEKRAVWGGRDFAAASFAKFFGHQVARGWKVKELKISPANGSMVEDPPRPNTAVAFWHGTSSPNATVNFRISKLVLTKPDGVCAQAITEAFR